MCMKKRILLMMMCLTAIISTTQAQWNDTYQPRGVEKAANGDITTISSTGDVYVAGIFDQAFTFGTTELEPIATSTYLIKYNAAGEKQWGVAFAGSATPTAMTTDGDGNVYIAGNFADEVVFGSTDDNSQTKTGVIDEDTQTPIEDQAACFLAKYSSSGILLKLETYLPKPFSFEDFMYYEPYENLSFSITHLEFNNNTLYASVNMSGITENNNITLKGAYAFLDSFMYDNIYAGALISLNEDLQFSKIYATLSAPDDETFQYNVRYPRFTFSSSGNFLYFSAKALGNLQLIINGTSEDITFFSDGKDFSEGYVITQMQSISGEKELVKTFEAEPQDYYLQSERTLNALIQKDDKLYLTGTFGNELTFDKTIVSNGDADAFLAILNLADLSFVTAKQSNDSGKEKASSTTYVEKGTDKYIYISCNDTAKMSSGIFEVNLSDYTSAYTNEAAMIYTNVINVINGKIAKVQATTSSIKEDLSTVTVSLEDVNTSINNPTLNNQVNFYPNPVVKTMYFSEVCNVNIYNTLGMLVKQATAVDNLNVESLTKGIYFGSIQTSQGISKIKFIKK